MMDEKGYDVKLVDGFPDKYRCHFCHLVFRDPVQTFRGERACKSCYFAVKSINPAVCPIDKEPIDDDEIFQDKHLMREIGQLKCYCNNNELGCSWKGELLELQKHLDSCGFNFISCDMCNNLVLKISLMAHQNEECLFRLVSCPDCDLYLKANELEKHVLFCPMRPVECPFNCKKKAPFSELSKHFQVCPQLKENFNCPYKLIGCLYQATSAAALEVHLNSSDHFMMAVTIVKKLQENNENLKSELQKQKESSEQQSLKYQSLRKEIELVKADLKICQDKVERLSYAQEPVTKDQFTKFEKQLNECKKKIDELTPKKANIDDFRNLAPKIENISGTADKIEITNAILGESMSDIDLKLQILENTRYDGRHLWRINNFRFRLRQAEEGKCPAIHSAPSFTGRGGYKFCSRLYLNGDGSGARTHISLYFVVMRSEYDQLLEWPFKKRVTFRLINVLNQKESHEESFKPDINSSSFQRPIRDMNTAAGCPLFFPKEHLFSPKYLVDDSIFLEIIVNE